jgi:hypothetical protein
MPQDYVEIPVGDGTEIPFAVDDPTYDGPVPAGKIRSSVQNGVTASLESGAGLVRRIADTVRKEIDSLDDRPDKVKVEVGLAATASGQIVVAATSAQAHINIGMEWSGGRRA